MCTVRKKKKKSHPTSNGPSRTLEVFCLHPLLCQEYLPVKNVHTDFRMMQLFYKLLKCVHATFIRQTTGQHIYQSFKV